MFSITDRYVLWRVFGVMLATMTVGVLVLCLARMLLFIQSGASFAQEFLLIVTLTSLFIPHYLGFMLPLALFWGTYSVVRRLSLNSELTSLFASGVSFKRFSLPLVAAGVVVTLINLAVLGWVEPWARYTFRKVRFHIENASPYLAAREGVFMQIGHQTILVEHIDRDNNAFRKVFVYQSDENGNSTEISATHGELISDGFQTTLLLRNGSRLMIEPHRKAQAVNPATPELLDFESLAFPLTQHAGPFRIQGDDEQELSLVALYQNSAAPPPGTFEAEMVSELHRKAVIILSSLFLPLLAALCAQTNLRGRNVFQGIFSLAFMLVYQQLIQFGGLLTDKTGLSPTLTMWPTFGILAAGSLLLVLLQDARSGRPGERMSQVLYRIVSTPRRWFAPPNSRPVNRPVHRPVNRPINGPMRQRR